jgi:hypothetical protein
VLRSSGRSLGQGHDAVWTFLIRTPELVETGIRNILQHHLGREVVVKRGLLLPGSTLTFNPDLRFWDRRAVADVKYKLSTGQWQRADLYQVLAFAAALRCTHAAVMNFSADASYINDPVLSVGDYEVHQSSWPASNSLTAADAASAFCASVSNWLSRVP